MKIILSIVLVVFIHFSSWAQMDEEKEPLTWEQVRAKLFFQPGGSFFFTQGTGVLGLSPSVGYRILPKTSVGLGPSFLYVRNFPTGWSRYEWGGSVFARQRIGQRLFAQVEYEQVNREIFTISPVERQWVPGFLVGGGLFQQTGPRSGFMAALFYNLLWDPGRSNTNSPLITRIGFVF